MQELQRTNQAQAEHISQYDFANNYLGDQWATWGEAYADINMISPHMAERLKSRVEKKLNTTAKPTRTESTSTRRTSTDSCSFPSEEGKNEASGSETATPTGAGEDNGEDAVLESRKHLRESEGASEDESDLHESKHKRRRTSSDPDEEASGEEVHERAEREQEPQPEGKVSVEESKVEENHITYTYGGYIMSLD